MIRIIPGAILLCLSLACAGTPDPASSDQPAAAAVDVVELNAAEAGDRMAAGTLTSRALTQAYLDRIAAIDDAGPELNSVIETNPSALSDAEALDANKLDAIVAPSMSPAWITDHVLGDHFVGAGYTPC